MLNVEKITEAYERLQGNVVQTPLIKSQKLDDMLDADTWLKCENLQHTGSFKFRGAYNAISQIPKAQRKKGIVACSSGNHAQGVAAAAQIFGMPAKIVMPDDAPIIKVENTKSYGAEVILYNRLTDDRDAIAQDISDTTGASLIHPFENYDVMAGQGTSAIEFMAQLDGYGKKPDLVAICCGGGGLTAGVSTVVSAISPNTELFAVEPVGFDDTYRSLQTGSLEKNPSPVGSICDAITTPMPGEFTFPINYKLLSGAVAVTDAQVLEAIKFAVMNLKIIIEPGGAVCLAAALSNILDVKGKTAVLMVSGGNIDADMLKRALS